MKNNLVKRIADEQDKFFNAGRNTGEQLAADLISIALYDVGVSKTKIREAAQLAMKMSKDYGQAIDTVRNSEADVWQERMDARLQTIFPEDFVPFRERYEWIKEVRYGKTQRG